MSGRIRQLVYPQGSSLWLSAISAGAMDVVVVERAGLFDVDSNTTLTGLGVAVLILLPIVTFIAVSHITGIARIGWAWLDANEQALGVVAALLAGAVLVWVGGALAPAPPPSEPAAMAPGGLTVFATTPLSEVSMTVQRTDVGVGSDDRQVVVQLSMRAPLNHPFRVALVGSGASTFDVAAYLSGNALVSSDRDAAGKTLADHTFVTLYPMDVVDVPDLLPLTADGHVAASRTLGTVSVMAPWFDQGTVSAMVLPEVTLRTDADVDDSATYPYTVLAALRLTHPSVGGAQGDLGDVGCASALDSIARAMTDDPTSVDDLVHIPGHASDHWFIPAKCDATVTIGQIADSAIYLAGTRTGGAGLTDVKFTGTSERKDHPVVGVNTLTIASTGYWVPDTRVSARHETLSNVALGLAATAFGGVAFGLWRMWRATRRKGAPVAQPGTSAGAP